MAEARRRQQRVNVRPRAGVEPETVRVTVKLGPVRDVPTLHANQAVVNFTGAEFILTVVSAVPPPWRKGERPPTEIEGRILGRYVFNVPQWVEFIKNTHEQVTNLEKSGAISVEFVEQGPAQQ